MDFSLNPSINIASRFLNKVMAKEIEGFQFDSKGVTNFRSDMI